MKLGLGVLFCLLVTSWASAGSWEKINEKDGIQVFRKQGPETSLVEFRGEGLVEAPLEKVASVIFDCVRSKEWVEDVVESHIDHWINDHQWIEYDHMGLLSLLKTGIFVTQGSGELNSEGYDLLLTYKSVEDPALPLTKYVRGNILRAIAGLKTSEGARSTHVVMEALVDPKGNVPHWMVNIVQKKWAITTFRNLRRQVQKQDIKIEPYIKKLLEKKEGLKGTFNNFII